MYLRESLFYLMTTAIIILLDDHGTVHVWCVIHVKRQTVTIVCPPLEAAFNVWVPCRTTTQWYTTKYLMFHIRPWSSNMSLSCQSWRAPSHWDLPAHCKREDRWILLPRVPGHYHVSTWIQTRPTVVGREMTKNLADCRWFTCGAIDHLCLGIHRVPYRFPQFIPGCLSVTPKSDFGSRGRLLGRRSSP
jgi:hypothetical protein